MKFWILLILGAVSPYLFQSVLPSRLALCLLLLLAISALVLPAHRRVYCLFPLTFLLVTLAINERLSQRLPLTENRSIHQISGMIGSLPERHGDVVRFIFLADAAYKPVVRKIRVYWYEDRHGTGRVSSKLPELHAGERWRLELELRVPRGRVNFYGADAEQGYFAHGIEALAYVQKGNNVRLTGPARYNPQHWRESVLNRMTELAGRAPAFPLLAALAVADRRGLTQHHREIMSATGTGHLLAISGLHIGLAAAMGFYLGRLGLLLFSAGLKQHIAIGLPWLMSWSAAAVYAALAGFGVSTQRALIMLGVAGLVVLSRRNVHPFLAWLIAMSVVLLADPFAPLRAGFWFSFAAVAVLLLLFMPRHGQTPLWQRMIFAQLGISLVMAPLGMYWFQQASLPGLLANLVAIPLVSLVTVPLILMALPLLWLPGPTAEWLLMLAAFSAQNLLLVLEYISAIQPLSFSATHAPGLAVTLFAMLGAAVLLLPRNLPWRFTGLLLMLPVLLPLTTRPVRAQAQIDLLDVGQGLSVLLTFRGYQMLYDTGPGNGLNDELGWDMVSGTIQPMIRATGRTPDLVVASHADLDHAGGLQHLQSKYPAARYLASMPPGRTGYEPCRAPAEWLHGGFRFRVIHPSAGLPYLGNESSCVISVTGPALRLLLSGDITRVVEQRLVENGLEPHTILTAPHHGSSTSSSEAFIETLQPSLVLISAAIENRFGFPRGDVLQRYAQVRADVINTAQCGGIRINVDDNGRIKLESARVGRNAIWRWPAENCRIDE